VLLDSETEKAWMKYLETGMSLAETIQGIAPTLSI
jgi:hypothetical protein